MNTFIGTVTSRIDLVKVKCLFRTLDDVEDIIFANLSSPISIKGKSNQEVFYHHMCVREMCVVALANIDGNILLIVK